MNSAVVDASSQPSDEAALSRAAEDFRTAQSGAPYRRQLQRLLLTVALQDWDDVQSVTVTVPEGDGAATVYDWRVLAFLLDEKSRAAIQASIPQWAGRPYEEFQAFICADIPLEVVYSPQAVPDPNQP